MNPADFLFVLLALGLAAFAVACDGWTLNSVGPGVLLIAGSVWNLWMSWLRHRSWLHHRESGFAPPTQHLLLIGVAGLLVGTVAAFVWVLLTHVP